MRPCDDLGNGNMAPDDMFNVFASFYDDNIGSVSYLIYDAIQTV